MRGATESKCFDKSETRCLKKHVRAIEKNREMEKEYIK